MIKQFIFSSLFFFIIQANVIYAQIAPKQESLLNGIESLIFINPDESLKIAMHLLEKENTSEEEIDDLNLLVAIAYKVKGEYGKSLEYLYKYNLHENQIISISNVKNIYLRAQILRKLLLERQATDYLNQLTIAKKNITDVFVKSYIEEVLRLEELYNQSRDNYNKNIHFADQINQGEKVKFPTLILDYLIEFVKLDLENKQFDLARKKVDTILIFNEKNKNTIGYYNIEALLLLSKIDFYENNYLEALKQLEKALSFNDALKNKYIQDEIYDQEIVNYLALNDTFSFKNANVDFERIHSEVESLDQETTNIAYNLILEENNYKKNLKEAYYVRLFRIIGICTIVILFILFLFWYKNYQRNKSLLEIISYLKVTRKNLISNYKEKKEYSKKITIPQKTEEILLSKLQKFEKSSRFLNKDLSLAVLAGQFETNTKYLSEIINSNYNVNYNTYINKLRISYIVDKLKTDSNYLNYKISYLAESSGFSSHSSFATVFKSITGISPVKFIELLKEEKEKSVA